MLRIVGFAGRKGSGKTTIAQILINKGFKKISFADWLKDTTCEIFEITREELDKVKNEILPEFKIQKYKINELIQKNPELEKFREDFNNKIITSFREFLQWFGSDVCRVIDFDWHVKKTIEIIKSNPSINYVCDDVRFINEKQAIESLNGQVFFILAPWNWDISNHISEISLKWQDFNQSHIIINDKKLSQIQKYYESFFDRLISSENPWDEQKLLYSMLQNGESSSKIGEVLNCSRDKIVWWANRLNFPIKRNIYVSDDNAFANINSESAYLAGLISSDGCIKCSGPSKIRYVLDFGSTDKELVEYLKKYLKTDKNIYINESKVGIINNKEYSKKDFYYLINENSLILENLKQWNIVPQKSMKEDIPYLVDKNLDYLYDWLRGIIDGDGSVFITDNNGYPLLVISFLISRKIGKWLNDLIDIPHSYNNHKDYENLMEFRFNGQYALTLAKRCWGFPRLSRKWDLIFSKMGELITC